MDTSFINVSLIVIGALAVCAAIAWLMTLGSNQGPRQDAENHASTTDSSDQLTTKSKCISNWFGIAQRSESVIAQPKPTDEQHRANEEVYWQESLRRQRQSNHITIVAAGVGIAGLVILFGTLLGTCKQAHVMSESFQVDQRPYLVVDKVEWATTPSAGGSPTEANVTFKDIGKTPAVKVRKFIALRRFRPLSKSDPKGTEKLAAFLESAFSDLRKQSQAPEKYAAKIRSDIAPNVPQFSTATDTDRPPLTNQDIKDLAQSALAFFFVGIFQYTDGFKGTYETQSCYIFWATDFRLWHLCDAHNIIE